MKILADENMTLVAEIFSEFGEVSLCPGRNMGPEQLKDIDLLLVRSITQVNEALLAGSPVKFVGTATIGTDHIDEAYLAQQNIGFSNAPGCNAEAVVDYVLSAIYHMAAEKGFNPEDLTYGIVGVGNVGRRLQTRLERCGFKVLLNDPPRAENEAGFSSLNTVLEEADFICLHTPLSHEGTCPTYHLLGEEELKRLKPDAVLLNAGRGPVIDNQALLKVGKQRSDLSFVMDVWEHEPQVCAELAQRCSLVSPHIAGYSLEGKVRGTFMLYQAYCEFIGQQVEKTLGDFLPEASLRELEQQDHSPLQLMQRVYDIKTDDKLLRATLNMEPETQKTAFDDLRKKYRVRREFSSLTVLKPKQPKLMSAVGFQLAENSDLP